MSEIETKLLDRIGRIVILSCQVTAKNIMLSGTCSVTDRRAPGFQPWHTTPFIRTVVGKLVNVNDKYALIYGKGQEPILENRGGGCFKIVGWTDADRYAHVPLKAITDVKVWSLQ